MLHVLTEMLMPRLPDIFLSSTVISLGLAQIRGGDREQPSCKTRKTILTSVLSFSILRINEEIDTITHNNTNRATKQKQNKKKVKQSLHYLCTEDAYFSGDVKPVAGLRRHHDRHNVIQTIVYRSAVCHQRGLGLVIPQHRRRPHTDGTKVDCGEKQQSVNVIHQK